MKSNIGLATWKNQPLPITILRLWLGVTWIYGGWTKAIDSVYFAPSGPTSFAGQTAGYIGHSPISFILKHMLEHSTLFAWFVMLSEFAIGICVIAGIAMQPAILGGFGMAIVLWLSVTYHVYPYFLSSDLGFAASWLAFFFMWRTHTKGRSRSSQNFLPDLRDRREVLSIIGAASAAVIAALAGGSFQKKIALSKNIVKAADFPVGSSMPFTSKDGSPAVLFRTKSGVYAYSAVCTHQGCTVAYDALSHALNCACHGAKFDATSGGVLAGPAVTGLPKISVQISGTNIIQI